MIKAQYILGYIDNATLRKYVERMKSYTAKALIAYLAEHNVKTILDQLAFYKKAHKGYRTY